MDLFTQRIDTETHKALSVLAISSVQFIYSDGCNIEMGNPNICVAHLSIQIADRKFVVLQIDWDDTSKERIDYYLLRAIISDRPKGVRVKRILDGKNCPTSGTCSIFISGASKKYQN